MGVALLALLAGAIAVAASSTVALTSDLPTTAVHVAVGDVITVTLPPALFTPPSGYSGPGSMSYPLPFSSDSTVLPRVSGTYDADGTMHAGFQGAQAGTATISVSSPAPVWCKTTATTSSSTSHTTSSSASSVAVVAAPSTATTTTTTSTVSTATPSPSPPVNCIAVDPTVPRTVTVVVSATGVQSAVTVPSAGSGGSPVAGVALAAIGALAASACVAAVRREQHRRRG